MTRDAIIKRDAATERCIEACRDCHSTCVETTVHCLRMGEEHAEAGHVTLLQDCAQACELSEEVMLRESTFKNRVCALCADICEACAESCEKYNEDAMGRCAERCRSCASACREMVTGGEIRYRLTSFS